METAEIKWRVTICPHGDHRQIGGAITLIIRNCISSFGSRSLGGGFQSITVEAVINDRLYRSSPRIRGYNRRGKRGHETRFINLIKRAESNAAGGAK